ncbi:MAG: hypothetical protein IPG53_15675 [Ignavibacteriales bacterium]|nr:hypothetical protein [Ignavibacteriales bacterium]
MLSEQQGISAGTKIKYSVFLRYGDKTTQVPYNTEITTLVTGKTGIIIDTIPLYALSGVLLAVRAGSEYFNPNQNSDFVVGQ